MSPHGQPLRSDDAIVQAFRDERPAVLATLIRQAGDFQLAEDAVQDAFADAVTAWRRAGGVPNRPRRLDHSGSEAPGHRPRAPRRIVGLPRRATGRADAATEPGGRARADLSAVVDDRLRLIFTCCHPALQQPAQVALTLRMLGGLTTGEIARAFLVAEPTMGKRIVRAKRKIAEAHIPYRVPPDDELPDRLRGCSGPVLVFNEGYSATGGDLLVREELCGEAIRLGRLLAQLMPDDAEVLGLLALMLLHDARRSARVDSDGGYVELARQDRTLWDRGLIAEGLGILERAFRLGPPGEYQLQAAITAAHIEALDAESTDWAKIAELYGVLAKLTPSSVVEVNRAAAVAFAQGPLAGLTLLEPLLGDGWFFDAGEWNARQDRRGQTRGGIAWRCS